MVRQLMASMNAEWHDVSWASLNLPLLQGECISPSEAQQKANDDDVFTALAGHGVHVDEDVLRIVCFLYMKCYRDDDDDKRRKEIPELVVGAAKAQMLEIIHGDACGVTENEERFHLWRLWQVKLLQYTLLPDVSTIFIEKKKTLMLRKQTTPTSFLHAVASFLAYKSRFDAKEISTHTAETLESSKLIRCLFNSDMLYKLVVGNKSSNSADLLYLITGQHLRHASRVRIIEGCFDGSDAECDHITSHVENHGPALVSGFRVDEKFNSRTGEGELQPGEIFQFDCDDYERCIRNSQALSRKDQEIDGTFKEISIDNDCYVLFPEMSIRTATESGCEESSSEVTDGSNRFVSNLKGKEKIETQADESVGGQAMVLVGYRRDENGKHWFLLQNTWINMFLIEVSASFLASRISPMGSIIFLRSRTPWPLPVEFESISSSHALLVESDLDGSDDPTNTDVPAFSTDG